MTILHDNLYTKRAVSSPPGRNRYLSRAMWVNWVPPRGNEKLLQKKPVTTKNNLNWMSAVSDKEFTVSDKMLNNNS